MAPSYVSLLILLGLASTAEATCQHSYCAPQSYSWSEVCTWKGYCDTCPECGYGHNGYYRGNYYSNYRYNYGSCPSYCGSKGGKYCSKYAKYCAHCPGCNGYNGYGYNGYHNGYYGNGYNNGYYNNGYYNNGYYRGHYWYQKQNGQYDEFFLGNGTVFPIEADAQTAVSSAEQCAMFGGVFATTMMGVLTSM